MRKIGSILFIFILLTGCSVLKKGNKSNAEISVDLEKNSLEDKLEKQNLTNRSFFIQKADIEVYTDNENQSFSASIRFVVPDTFLISLRSKSGIEAARIFISKDTLLINDRINRKLYYGKPEYLEGRYGFSASLLPVILGDFIKDNKEEIINTNCLEGKLDLEQFLNGLKIRYTVDCKRGKIILVTQEGSLRDIDNKVRYSNFIRHGDILIPAKIQINIAESMTNINIRFKKIESPWKGSIEFIPGNKYELIELR